VAQRSLDAALSQARVLWSYLVLAQAPPPTVDVIVALGSHDVRVAARAADLMLDRHAPLLVTTGGYGKITETTSTEPEGRVFARVATGRGVDAAAIVVEDKSSHAVENITRTRDMLAGRGIRPASGLLVCKPYMERRSLATAQRQWPEVTWAVTSPDIRMEECPTAEVPLGTMIELMVGCLQRIEVYGEAGLLVRQDIPAAVRTAGEELVRLGFDQYLL
jgi:uncharacterized SAM-binding protein YcdF (DUF218 family)